MTTGKGEIASPRFARLVMTSLPVIARARSARSNPPLQRERTLRDVATLTAGSASDAVKDTTRGGMNDAYN